MPDIFEINLHPRAHPILSTVSLTLYVILPTLFGSSRNLKLI